MIRAVCILSLLVVLLGNPSHAGETEEARRVGVTFLPELVSGYSFLATWYPDLLQALESPEAQEKHKLLARNVIARHLGRLHGSLLALRPDRGLPWGIDSSPGTFLVQGEMKGQVYGYPWAKEPDYSNNLFITLPASEAAMEIVAISSSMAPQHTTIFSLSTALDAVLIYDSLLKNTLPPAEPLASIYQVRVRSPVAFELRERLFRPTQGVGGGRVLLLAKGKDGKWRLSVIRQGPIRRG
jgi:hypothetical protein